MANPGQVMLIYPGGRRLFLYTHYGADRLPKVLAAGLLRGVNRWRDPAYLVRILASGMIEDSGGTQSELGMGIDVGNQGVSIADTIVIDLDDGVIRDPEHTERFTPYQTYITMVLGLDETDTEKRN